MQPLRHFDIADLRRFAARFDQGAMEAWLAELLERHGSHEFAGPDYTPRLAARLREVVIAGRPASCLRLGDGEGNILAADDTIFRNLQRLAAEKAAEIHLGRWFPDSVLRSWSREMLAAIGNADVVGVPCTDRIAGLYRDLQHPPPDARPDIRGACGTINALRFAYAALSQATPRRVVTNCAFHRTLLPHYRSILGPAARLGVIGCHPELPDKLKTAFGARQVDFFAIPNQASNTGKRSGPPHYPDRFNAVTDSLSGIEKGQVVLVAAGILGKLYCDRVKQCGGIALDIGSVADVWVGRRARRYHKPAYLDRWKL